MSIRNPHEEHTDSADNPERVAAATTPASYRAFRRKACIALFIALACLFAAVFASFMLGRYPVDPVTVVDILASGITGSRGSWTDAEATVVTDIRLPRILAAIAVGSALAIAGAAYQGIFRNPVVSPDILGASAGASVGAAFAMLMEWPLPAIEGSAFVMGIVAVGFSYLLSQTLGRNGNRVLLLVLCGMVSTTLFQAGVSIIKYLADPNSTLPEITYWLMGSIAKVNYVELTFFLLPYLVSAIVLLSLRWKLNVMSFSDEEASALGIDADKIRIVCIVCATLLTSSTVAIAGTVGWVGLMIPHLVRFIVGSNYRLVMPLSLAAGALFLLIVDNACRCLLAYEIPLGILTALIGAPFFVFVLFQRRGQIG